MGEMVNLLVSSFLAISNTQISLIESEPYYWTFLDVQPPFDNIGMPQQLPIILYAGSRFSESESIKLRDLMRRIAPISSLALLLVFIPSGYVQEALNLLKDHLQRVYAYDIVPVTYENFIKIIASQDPRKELRQLILSQVDLNLISPFIINGPTPESLFFGREYELRAITEHAATTSYALIGGRRIGKTSILKRLEGTRLPIAGFRALYHDCAYTPTQAELVEAVVLNKSWFSSPPSNTLRSFTKVIQALSDDKPIVIVTTQPPMEGSRGEPKKT